MKTQTRIITSLAAASIAAAGLLALTGCTARVVEEPAATAPAAETTAPVAPAPAETQSAPDATADSPAPEESAPEVVSTDGDATGAAGASETRTDLSEGVTASLTCNGGALTIDGTYTAQVVEVTDDCSSLTINSNTTVVVAQNVGTLNVAGSTNNVLVASAQSVTMDGTANVVSWETGSPQVSNSGNANAAFQAD
ncbi:DUF3060 domain-containing protein [Pseudoclavibacter helvolus]|uniref:Cytoskeletal protein RodZ n=1 Tax=Pseudoclavibacter helvolus TaxID=255205 RepID=A0A7W4YFI3_9MICO|nr:DUF3060 domain-containing protein [Pseudoclavibacter helvolus]MBB2958639.1 cytoskeletal protein RodZ [Pseudoclavibacter helvolus]